MFALIVVVDFYERPIRPSRNLKNDNYLGKYPASVEVVHAPLDRQQHLAFIQTIKDIPTNRR